MSGRLEPISDEQATALCDQMAMIEDRLFDAGNVGGPALGAKWCDAVIRLAYKVRDLRYKLEVELAAKQRKTRK